jgi:hypothetical protein
VSVILNVGPVTCGTVTRVERTASSKPVHRTVRDLTVLADAAGADELVAGSLPAGTFDPQQAATTAAHTTTAATRMLVAILDAFRQNLDDIARCPTGTSVRTRGMARDTVFT